MVILSYEFALGFVLFFLLYWACYRSVVIQNYLLILAGLLFLLSWQWQFVFSVLFVWFVSHISVIFFKKYPQKRKKILLISVALLLTQLCFFKYTNFTIEQLNDSILKENNLNPLDIVMPLGISFYTFQAISYVVDVYKQKITPLPSKILLGFLSFVPTITAGPIFRASHAKEQWIADNPNSADIAKQRLVKEISENLAEKSGKKLSKDTKKQLVNTQSLATEKPRTRQVLLPYLAIALVFIAMFKKIVLAGWLESLWVLPVFANPMQFHALEVLTAVYAYSLQLFFDFSGYTDLAIAIGLLLGFRLPENFDRPYLATDIQDFWNRWHMTLSTWIRDYVYIPLGGNRGSFWRVQFNLMMAFILSGIWHGAGWNFLIWGIIHGVALVWLNLMKCYGWRGKLSQYSKGLAIFLTFHYVAFGWIFFHSTNFEQAKSVLSALTNFEGIGLSLSVIPTLWLMSMLWLMYPFLANSRQFFANLLQKLPIWLLPVVITMYVLMVFNLAPEGLPNFIYANF